MAIQMTFSKKDENKAGWWWISGDTKADTFNVKDILKANKCRWSRKRKAWYYIGDVLPTAISDLLDGDVPVSPALPVAPHKQGKFPNLSDKSTPGGWLDVADCAKIVRWELKNLFPDTKFSVNISRFSMGNSMEIDWFDGPTRQDVEAVVMKYKYSHIEDIVTDSFGTHPINQHGFQRGGAKYIHCNAHLTTGEFTKVVEWVVNTHALQTMGGEPLAPEDITYEIVPHRIRNKVHGLGAASASVTFTMDDEPAFGNEWVKDHIRRIIYAKGNIATLLKEQLARHAEWEAQAQMFAERGEEDTKEEPVPVASPYPQLPAPLVAEPASYTLTKIVVSASESELFNEDHTFTTFESFNSFCQEVARSHDPSGGYYKTWYEVWVKECLDEALYAGRADLGRHEYDFNLKERMIDFMEYQIENWETIPSTDDSITLDDMKAELVLYHTLADAPQPQLSVMGTPLVEVVKKGDELVPHHRIDGELVPIEEEQPVWTVADQAKKDAKAGKQIRLLDIIDQTPLNK
jgi:hypothetical protein